MNLPEFPMVCNVCKGKMILTVDKDNNPVGMVKLPVAIEGKEMYLYPKTALCETCGHVEFFVVPQGTVTE